MTYVHAPCAFKSRPVVLLLLLLAFLVGCPPNSEDPQEDADTGWTPEEDTGRSEDSDVEQDDDIEQPDDPLLCPLDFGLPAEGCDLVYQDDCPAGAFCQLALAGGSQTPRPLCIGLNHAGPQGLGEDCSTFEDATRCQPGMLCANWSTRDPRGMACSQYCLMDTGEGCAQDSYCTHLFSDISGYGLCVPRCDPYQQTACPDGFACVPDPTYGTQRSCWPEFRCMLNNAPAGDPIYKKPCDVNALHQSAGCPLGLTCYPSGVTQLCVQPCRSDADCTGPAEGLTCKEPRGELQLRYCE
jgi:hypothetical protein